MCRRLVKELQASQKPGSRQEGSSSRGHEGTGQEGSGARDYEGTGRKGYTLDQQGLLCYKEKAVVPEQKSLIQELMYLYHDDQLAGHWGVDKTTELL